jgi:hypothetical protein
MPVGNDGGTDRYPHRDPEMDGVFIASGRTSSRP